MGKISVSRLKKNAPLLFGRQVIFSGLSQGFLAVVNFPHRVFTITTTVLNSLQNRRNIFLVKIWL
jgi:hypothetical protein